MGVQERILPLCLGSHYPHYPPRARLEGKETKEDTEA